MGPVRRPRRRFIFFEHGGSPNPRVQRRQRWSEPIAYWLFEGCHLRRDIPSLVTQRVQGRADGNGLPRPISEVVVVLVVGHRGSGVTAGAV